MKRHRQAHLLVWVVLVPVMALVIVYAAGLAS